MPGPTLRHADLIYARYPDRRDLRLDLYLPDHGRPVPLVIWIHGGAWMHGDKLNPPVLPYLPDAFALASIEYHFSHEALFPAQIHACKAAVRWLRAHARELGYDGHRIGVMGASAGGHLAALLGTGNDQGSLEGTDGEHPSISSTVQAVVDLFGPTDFLDMLRYESDLDHAAPSSPEGRLIGGAVREWPARVSEANPITYIGAHTCPMLILHGCRDRVVPWQQSDLLAAALRQAGCEVELHLIENAGHGGPEFADGIQRRRILDFLARTLTDGPHGPSTSDA